jgi:zinc transport system substrate-binding protein
MLHFPARPLRTLTLLSALALATGAHASEVVTSIKPLQLITAALTEGVTRPEVLLPAEGSPHHYALKPSDMRKLTDAKVIIWIGPGLEQFMVRPLSRTDAEIVTLRPDLKPHRHQEAEPSELDSGDDAHHDEPQQDAENPAADDHGEAQHDHGAGNDPHIWLDPMQGLDIAQRVLPALQRALPQHTEQLQQNYAAFATALQQKERAIAAQLAPYHDAGFFVFHDAYSGFVDHYGLKQLGYFTVDPSRKPGARHLAEIRQQLEAASAVCVFSEPQFTSAVVDAITSGLPVAQGELDPLARSIELSADGYLDYLQSISDSFRACLAKKAD